MTLRTFKKTQHHVTTTNGNSIIEVIIAIFVITVAFTAILQSLTIFLKGGLLASDQLQAHYVLEETVEAVRFLRDESFSSNITPLVGTGAHYLEPTTSGWRATTTSVAIFGTFSRAFEITEVYRANSDDNIVPSTSGVAKTLDSGTVQLTVTVEWPGGERLTASTYVTDLYEN